MADSVSTEAWLDQRRWAALEEALKAQGSNVKRHLQDYLITLYNETVPLERWVQIETAITKEELESAQAAEDQKVYAAFHIRENGHDSIFSTGNGEEFLDVAINFDPDEVFGTNVASAFNDDWLNVYANFDWKTGRIDSALTVCLVCSDGHEFEFSYPLTPAEQVQLWDQMDAY